jgi:8-oxo-dGTP pyrophosphatase MutT (NUDIX family)
MKRNARYQAAIIRDHHILLLKISDRGNRFWLIPGGGKEEGETDEECVRREALEETHLQVAVDRLILSEPSPNDSTAKDHRTYLCRIIDGEASPGIEPEAGDRDQPIKGLAWLDLRNPDSWETDGWRPSQAFSLLRRIGHELGYTKEPDSLLRSIKHRDIAPRDRGILGTSSRSHISRSKI